MVPSHVNRFCKAFLQDHRQKCLTKGHTLSLSFFTYRAIYFVVVCPSQLPFGCLFLSAVTQVFANSVIIRGMFFSRKGSFCTYVILLTSSSFSSLYPKTCFAFLPFVELLRGLREHGFWPATASAKPMCITG